MTPQQIAAGRLAGALLRLVYGVRFSDIGTVRAISRPALDGLGMQEPTYGWNLEMQMRAAAGKLRIVELPVGCRRRVGGVSQSLRKPRRDLPATWVLMRTFIRLAAALRRV